MYVRRASILKFNAENVRDSRTKQIPISNVPNELAIFQTKHSVPHMRQQVRYVPPHAATISFQKLLQVMVTNSAENVPRCTEHTWRLKIVVASAEGSHEKCWGG